MITIVALCFLIYSWSQYSQKHQRQEFTAQYNQGLATSSAAFLGHLIEDENSEVIESIGHQLVKQPHIQKIAIYRRSGELMYEEGKKQKPHSEPVIANIAYDDSYNGYLIIYFTAASAHINNRQAFWLDNTMIWGLGALLWLFILVLFNANRWFRKRPKTPQSATEQPTRVQHNTQLLKDLIRRSRKENKDKIINSSIIIKAQWSRLDDKTNHKLLRILSRWLPQNGLFATLFSRNLLTLGLSQEHVPIKRNPLYALAYCLNHLQLEPKIILHRLDFGQEIYETFFNIIEPGIWFEKRLIETDSDYHWPVKKVIDIELDEAHSIDTKGSTIIELCQLAEPDAEQRGLIERQIRFLSDE